MRPEAFRATMTSGNVDQRVAFLSGLSGREAVRLEGSLFAVLLTDTSLQVRRAAEETLARRPEDYVKEQPVPVGSLTQKKQAELILRFADDAQFLSLLLATTQGRTLLGRLDLGQVPLDDRLLLLAERIEPALLRDVLMLPIDVSGRAVHLLDRFPQLTKSRRDAILEVLVWASMQAAGLTSAPALGRANAALSVYVDGLLEVPPEQAPTFAEFVAAGASLGRGPVLAEAQRPERPTLVALADLARLIHLTLVVARRPLLQRAALEGVEVSPRAELRSIGWRLLAQNQLVSAAELMEAASKEPCAGVVVELLAQIRTELPPELTGRVVALLEHQRASVRLAAIGVLSRSPLAAALASAAIDPRADDAPLEILAAQPADLAGPSLVAYLETERSSRDTVHALDALRRPPSATWPRWKPLLESDSPRVRRATRAALLRLSPDEGPGILPYLPRLLADAPLAGVRAIDRFRLEDRYDDLAQVLLQENVHDDVARTAVSVLRRYGGGRAWNMLWTFVVGRPPELRYGSRIARRAAMEALLVVEPPPRKKREAAESMRELETLLTDRDPESVALALRYLGHHGAVHSLDELLYDLTQRVLARALRDATARRRSVLWRRFFRAFLPRAWVAPAPGPRGKLARVLALLLDRAVRLGVRGLWPEDVAPAMEHEAPGVRRAAVRLYLTLYRGPLEDLVARLPGDASREAILAGHQGEVEALITARLARACRASRPDLLAAVRPWLVARPLLAALPYLRQLLRLPRARGDVIAALEALHTVKAARDPVEALVRNEAEKAVASGDSGTLRPTAELLERLGLWSLVPLLLPALAWAGESARQRVVDLIRRAREEHVPLEPSALSPLLQHPLAKVRVLALSLLRSLHLPNLWEVVRPFGEGWSKALPTDFAKPFIGVCESHYEASMGLTLEGFLRHPNGEVARRALKLLNRREREVAALALFQNMGDAELRQPILTTFSTWSARFVDKSLSAELLEEERRKIRAAIAQFVEGNHPTRAAEAVRATLVREEGAPAPVAYVEAAALYAIGRLTLSGFEPQLLDALRGGDPMLQRCAAWSAGRLPVQEGGAELDAVLTELCRARDDEVRAAARGARVRRIDPERKGELEGLVSDPSPEVRLSVLNACRAYPAALSALTLEARVGDPDPRVRERVVVALGERPRGRPEALRSPLGDPQPEVRMAALAAVGAWGALDALRHEVGELLADPSIHVSGLALDLLGELAGDAPPVPPADDDDDDDDDEQTSDEAPVGEPSGAPDDPPGASGEEVQ